MKSLSKDQMSKVKGGYYNCRYLAYASRNALRSGNILLYVYLTTIYFYYCSRRPRPNPDTTL